MPARMMGFMGLVSMGPKTTNWLGGTSSCQHPGSLSNNPQQSDGLDKHVYWTEYGNQGNLIGFHGMKHGTELTKHPEAAASSSPQDDPVRERVLHCAEGLFLSQGFSLITMDALASELGMSKKTLYRYFPSKEALLAEVMDKRFARITSELEAVERDDRLNFIEKLRGMMGVMTERVAEVRQPFLTDIKRHAPGMFAKVEAFRGKLIPDLFGRLIENGRKDGMIRNGVAFGHHAANRF